MKQDIEKNKNIPADAATPAEDTALTKDTAPAEVTAAAATSAQDVMLEADAAADNHISASERISIWKKWQRNLKAWAWYHKEYPEWCNVDIQSAVKHHIIEPVRRETKHLHALRQKNRLCREFPETESRLGQLFLFGWSVFPRFGSLIREKLLHWRTHAHYTSGRIRAFFDKVHIPALHFLGGAVAIAVVALLLSLYTLGTTASYDGTELGTVSSARAVNAAVEHVEEITRDTLGEAQYTIDEDLLETRLHVIPRSRLTEREILEEKLSGQLGLVDYGYALYVDGELVAATPFEGALEELLEQLKVGYRTANTIECGFVEDVEIREEYVDRSYMMNLGYIAEILNETKSGEVTYTVKRGDVWSEIAEINDLSSEDLLKMNPGYNPSVLHAGDVLTLSTAVPYLTVLNVERQVYLQNIPYETVYEDDDSMYQGDFRTISAGEYGKADVTANVTYVNGTEQSREIVSSVTLREPVAEHQATGTKPRPSWFPTGSFRWPCSGVITSYFGYRNAFAGASRFHQGLDIANRTGTSIYASDGGTVIYSGWLGGYGYTVKVDHGNGFITYYAHCSSLYVSTGDHVYQGECIAAMGSTGIASGPHLHFGVMKNGTFMDPMNYL